MPFGGGLGLSSYLVLVGFLVGPAVIAFVIRRKWRRSVARRDEIKRLLVLASEEAARAELEASSTYVTSAAAEISRLLQYQCAVCLCLTTTRCARCKAVRYCSGKCQIIHWRQGHKEECRPFTISHHMDDVGVDSSQKVLEQEEDEIYGGRFVGEGRQFAKSVENFPEEHACSKPNGSSEVFDGDDDSEVECLSDGERTNSSSTETEGSAGYQSPKISCDNLETYSTKNMDQNRPLSSKCDTSIGSVDCLTSPEKVIQLQADGTNHSIQRGSTSSSGWSADGTNEPSFSEPSTPSSDFWEGTVSSGRLKIDTLEDSEAGDGRMHNSPSCCSFSFSSDKNPIPPLDVQNSDATTSTSDGHSSTLGIKKPIDRVAISKEARDDTSKQRNSPLSILEKYNRMDVDTGSDPPVSKSGDRRYTPSMSIHPPNVSSIRSLNLERSNHVTNGMNTTLQSLESIEHGSLSSSASFAHMPSNTGRHSLQGTKCGNNDIAASFSEVGNFSANCRNDPKTSTRKVVDHLKTSKSSRQYQTGVGSVSIGRYNTKGLFPYEIFVKIYIWNKIELRPCGLTNCGNSCYANAVLQCLAYTPPLTAYLVQGLHSKACARKEWCFTCEFESLITKAKKGTTPLSPIGILSQIQNIGSHLGNGREEDAHEFLKYAIDMMQSICLKEAGVHASESLEEETTLIGLTFGGYLRSKIKCMKCGSRSERHERMMDLTVEIDGDIGTLEEALRQFTGSEILDGENKYNCSRCRAYERAKKKLTILEAPNILTIALKRFQSGKFGKLNKAIKFPEILDLAPCMSGTSDKSPIYRLYGVVVHLDVMNAAFSGHYVCYVKTIQNKWFKIDDSTVKAVDLESVLTKGAYMLLYARCSPRAPRLVRNSIILKNHVFKSRSHPTSPWNPPNSLNDETLVKFISPNLASIPPIQTVLEEDSLSDNSSSIFSEGCSCSSDTTKWDSTSTDNDYYFEPFFSPWWNSSDSDTSSSSPSPSPLYSRLNTELSTDDRGFCGRIPGDGSNWEGKSGDRISYSDDKNKQYRKSSCRETNSSGLGCAKSSFSRSARERTD